jgi:thiamine pyrophosphate-dependent acetolactate synthase large subunit-like protein
MMRGRPAERYTTVREFGAVGNGLPYALGVAAARRQGRDGKIVLFEGDGGLLFNIQGSSKHSSARDFASSASFAHAARRSRSKAFASP